MSNMDDQGNLYTISQVAEMYGITTYALRYYDRSGLLPFVGRSKNGIRVFTEEDVRLIGNIQILREIGMPVSRIREYSSLYAGETIDNETKYERICELIHEQELSLKSQISELQSRLDMLHRIVDEEEEYRREHGLSK